MYKYIIKESNGFKYVNIFEKGGYETSDAAYEAAASHVYGIAGGLMGLSQYDYDVIKE